MRTQQPTLVVGDFNRILNFTESYIDKHKVRDVDRGIPSFTSIESASLNELIDGSQFRVLHPRFSSGSPFTFSARGGRGYAFGKASLDYALVSRKVQQTEKTAKSFEYNALFKKTGWCNHQDESRIEYALIDTRIDHGIQVLNNVIAD